MACRAFKQLIANARKKKATKKGIAKYYLVCTQEVQCIGLIKCIRWAWQGTWCTCRLKSDFLHISCGNLFYTYCFSISYLLTFCHWFCFVAAGQR